MSAAAACPHGQQMYCGVCKQINGQHPHEARKAAAPTMYQHLRCTNDNNGNPRRIFVFMDATGGIVAVEDEGYHGTPAACRGLVQLPTIETYPAERRDLLRTYPSIKEAGK